MYDVVVASRAEDPLILDALDSVYRQTLAPHRVVVVVDGHDELPHPWWEAIVTEFPSVELLRHRGSGMASATAAGIRHASSPYVAFLDSDDLWAPEKQAKQVEALDEEKRIDAVTSCARNVWTSMNGPVHHQPAFPCATFTATTFRATTFRKFGFPDPIAGHHTWLYRWWANARRQGICSGQVDYVGLERRIHGANSWCIENELAHRALLRELRTIIADKGQVPVLDDPRACPTSDAVRYR